jgi:hypothetical protein
MLSWQITVMVLMALVALIGIWGTAKNKREDAGKQRSTPAKADRR